MDSKIANWTEKQSLTYLFIHAGYADGDFSDSEKKWIRVNLGPEEFETVHQFYQGQTAPERENSLSEIIREKYSFEEAFEVLTDALKQIFLADGEYSVEEQELYRRLKGTFRKWI